MLVLLELDFRIVFDSGCVKVFLDKFYYGSRYKLNGFMVLDTANVFVNDDTIYVVENSSTSNDNESVI